MGSFESVLLIDDNENDNFFHERVLKKSGVTRSVLSHTSVASALNYLSGLEQASQAPALIFLDINLPGQNGWDFLAIYQTLDPAVHALTRVVLLSTSQHPKDVSIAASIARVHAFYPKPLTLAVVNELVAQTQDPGGHT